MVTPSPTGTLFIRPANWTDAPVIYAFLCELEEALIDQTRFRAVFRHNLTNPTVHYLVAEQTATVVGFASCHMQYLLHHSGKVAEIQEMFVHPDHRNGRIGQHLLDAITTLATGEGCINLEVTTNQRRPDAVRFYERAAFQRSHYKLVKPLQT